MEGAGRVREGPRQSEEAGEDRDREPGGQKVGSAVKEREKASVAGIGTLSRRGRRAGRAHPNHH